MTKVVVVDDEAGIRESLCYALARDGFEAVQLDHLALVEAELSDAALLVLDLMLPDGNGLEFLKQLSWYMRPFCGVSSVDAPFMLGTEPDFRGATSFYEAVYHVFDPPRRP